MTGPTIEDGSEGDEVIGVLRTAAHGGLDGTLRDVEAAVHAGRRIRARRRAFRVVGSGAVAAVIGVASIAVLNSGASTGRQIVLQPADAAPIEHKGKDGPDSEPDDVQILLHALGPDWRKGEITTTEGGTLTSPGTAELVPGSVTARQLPDGYRAGVNLQVFGAYVDPEGDLSLEQVCKPMVEKGDHWGACKPYTLGDGRVVQKQELRTALGEYRPVGGRTAHGASDGTLYYYGRADGSFVRLTLFTGDDAARSSKARQATAIAWLPRYDAILAAVAADPRLGPEIAAPVDQAPPTPAEQALHDHDQAVLQEHLGGSFTLTGGKIYLEPGSELSGDLPDPKYSVTAELSKLTGAAYDAACGPKPGAVPCKELTLADGNVVRVRTWADYDEPSEEVRGESAVYFVQPDGDIVLALLTGRGWMVPSAEGQARAADLRAWFDGLTDELVAAATDPRVQNTVAIAEMPNVVGMPYAKAAARLQRAGLTVPPPSTEITDAAPDGNVTRQTPAAGTKLKTGSEVLLVLARGASF